MRIVLRGFGWLLIAAGTVLALYLVYSLYWTGRTTNQAQERLLDEWTLSLGDIEDPTVPVDPDGAEQPLAQVDFGEAVAALEFHRPGSDDPPVYDGPLFIVEGVTVESLKSGPGHYPTTAYPGEMGNFAIAGHRTTYGAPFYDLEQVEAGDEIHVTDRNGTRWVYEVIGQEVVLPTDNHVLGRDPLGLGRPMLTLTTCNPRWSNAERLVVFAQLADDQLPEPLTEA